MRRARWLLPLLLALPLAAPGPTAIAIEGRAYEDEDHGARATLPSSLAPLDDGVSYATARILPSEPTPVSEPPAIEWSYGPLNYGMPERALEPTGTGEAPPTSPGGTTEPDARPDPVADAPVPMPPSGGPTPSPAPSPPAPEETDPDEGGADPEAPAAGETPVCVGLCFSLELGLL